MSHVIISFSNSSFLKDYPNADSAAKLFKNALIGNFPNAFDMALSTIKKEATFEDVVNKLDWLDEKWDSESSDWLVLIFCSHGYIDRYGILRILDDRFSLYELEQCLIKRNFHRVAVILDSCTYHAPRHQGYKYHKSANRIYAEMVDELGESGFGSNELGSAFSHCFNAACNQLGSIGPHKFTLTNVLRTANKIARITPRSDGGSSCFYIWVASSQLTDCRLSNYEIQITRHDQLNLVLKEFQSLDRNLDDPNAFIEQLDKICLSNLNEPIVFSFFITIINDVFKDARESFNYESVFYFIKFLFADGFARVGLTLERKREILIYLWHQGGFQDGWLVDFLIEKLISLEDVSFIVEKLAMGPSSVAPFSVPARLLLSRWHTQSEFSNIAQPYFHWLFNNALENAHSFAREPFFDSYYETSILGWVEWWNHYISGDEDGKMPITEGSGPDIYSKARELISDRRCPWNLRRRFGFIRDLAISFVQGKHWIASILCYELLWNTYYWNDIFGVDGRSFPDNTDEYDDEEYPSEISSKYPRIGEYLVNVGRKIGIQMRDQSSPAVYRLLLLLSRYRHTYFLGSLSLVPEPRVCKSLVWNLKRLLQENDRERRAYELGCIQYSDDGEDEIVILAKKLIDCLTNGIDSDARPYIVEWEQNDLLGFFYWELETKKRGK